jgi:hypothetical protein
MKRQIILLLLVCFYSIYLGAQDSTSHWSIGAQGSIFYSYRSLESSQELAEMKTLFDSLETSILGHQIGGIIRYTINNKFDISSGITYQRSGYNIDTLMEASIANMKFRYSFIKIPIRLHYNFRYGKINRPFIAAGITTNYCVADKTTFTEFGRATIIELEKPKITGNIINEISLTMGLMKTITPKTRLHIAIDGAYSLQPLENGELTRRLWNAGVWMSLTHHL